MNDTEFSSRIHLHATALFRLRAHRNHQNHPDEVKRTTNVILGWFRNLDAVGKLSDVPIRVFETMCRAIYAISAIPEGRDAILMLNGLDVVVDFCRIADSRYLFDSLEAIVTRRQHAMWHFITNRDGFSIIQSKMKSSVDPYLVSKCGSVLISASRNIEASISMCLTPGLLDTLRENHRTNHHIITLISNLAGHESCRNHLVRHQWLDAICEIALATQLPAMARSCMSFLFRLSHSQHMRILMADYDLMGILNRMIRWPMDGWDAGHRTSIVTSAIGCFTNFRIGRPKLWDKEFCERVANEFSVTMDAGIEDSSIIALCSIPVNKIRFTKTNEFLMSIEYKMTRRFGDVLFFERVSRLRNLL